MVILVFLMLSIITSCNYCPTKFYTRATAPVCSLSLCSPTLLSFHSCLELINSFCKPINFGFKGDYALNPPSVNIFFCIAVVGYLLCLKNSKVVLQKPTFKIWYCTPKLQDDNMTPSRKTSHSDDFQQKS